jgi:hypothetical protein
MVAGDIGDRSFPDKTRLNLNCQLLLFGFESRHLRSSLLEEAAVPLVFV